MPNAVNSLMSVSQAAREVGMNVRTFRDICAAHGLLIPWTAKRNKVSLPEVEKVLMNRRVKASIRGLRQGEHKAVNNPDVRF